MIHATIIKKQSLFGSQLGGLAAGLLFARHCVVQHSRAQRLGFVVGKIKGLQHYTSTISGRETITLVRQPLNRYDSNAIAVRNNGGHIVGHIEARAELEKVCP